MPTAIIPSLLRKYTDGRERLEVQGKNVREVIADLKRQFPALIEHLIEAGDIKPSVAVSIDGEIAPAGLLERVRPDSEIHFLPALGGG